jgi:hypothetical protein
VERKDGLTGRSLHNELVKSEALATSFGDSGAGSLGEAECSNGELGALKNSQIISDGADDNGDSFSTKSALAETKLTSFRQDV